MLVIVSGGGVFCMCESNNLLSSMEDIGRQAMSCDAMRLAIAMMATILNSRALPRMIQILATAGAIVSRILYLGVRIADRRIASTMELKVLNTV